MKFILITLAMLTTNAFTMADEFRREDLIRWQQEFDQAAKFGRELWTNAAPTKLGTNGVSCAQCHPNGSNTHPETYPKFQTHLSKVTTIWEMINWCIKNPLEGKVLAPDSKEIIALQAYIASERKGVALAPGKH
jgi:cytochrome c